MPDDENQTSHARARDLIQVVSEKPALPDPKVSMVITPASYKRQGSAVPPGIKVASAQMRRRTPKAFAEWLVALARTARRRQG